MSMTRSAAVGTRSLRHTSPRSWRKSTRSGGNALISLSSLYIRRYGQHSKRARHAAKHRADHAGAPGEEPAGVAGASSRAYFRAWVLVAPVHRTHRAHAAHHQGMGGR